MPITHEPREEFVTRLAEQIVVETRRAASAPGWRGWLLESRLKTALAAVCLASISMALGGGVVAAAYQIQASSERDSLVSTYTQQLSIAQQGVALAASELQAAEQRVSMGVDSVETVTDARVKVAEARASVQVASLELAEVGASGRDPVDSASAPLVSGRDFVTERLRAQMTVPEATREAELAHMAAARRKVTLGLASPADVESVRVRLTEVQLALAGFQKRLDIRQRYLNHEVDAAMADLLVLENDANVRLQTLLSQVPIAQRLVTDTETKVNIGRAEKVEVVEAELRLQELELEVKKAELDLAVVQRQIQQYRAK